jgi:hypothetical protein
VSGSESIFSYQLSVISYQLSVINKEATPFPRLRSEKEAPSKQQQLHQQNEQWTQIAEATAITTSDGYHHKRRLSPQTTAITTSDGYHHKRRLSPQTTAITTNDGYHHKRRPSPQTTAITTNTDNILSICIR